MFFKISNRKISYENPLSQTHQINQFTILTDQGWKQHESVLYKGYVLGRSLDDKVQQKNYTREPGNYVILDLGKTPAIHYDTFRSFPLYHNESTVTNLYSSDLTTVHNNSSVVYNQKWIYHNFKDSFTYNSEKPRNSFEFIVDFVCNLIAESCAKLESDLPIYVADTNGVDSTLVRSGLDYAGKSYFLGNYKDFQPIDFNHWGYRQLFDNHIPHIQATGFCGDEILLRNPLYCHWQLQPDGIDLIHEFDKVQKSYMKGFFDQKYKSKIAKDKNKFTSHKFAFLHLQNIVSNDYQMWHYNNIISFTPLRNGELLETVLYAEPDAILRQVIHGDISKECIKRLNPDNLTLLSDNKNNVG